MKLFLCLRLQSASHANVAVSFEKLGKLIDNRVENKHQALKLISEGLWRSNRVLEIVDDCPVIWVEVDSLALPSQWLEYAEVETLISAEQLAELEQRLMGKFGNTYFDICSDFAKLLPAPRDQARKITYNFARAQSQLHTEQAA